MKVRLPHRAVAFCSPFANGVGSRLHVVDGQRNTVDIMEQTSQASESDPVAPANREKGWIPLGPYNWLTPALTLSIGIGLLAGVVVNFAFQIVSGLLGADSHGIGFQLLASVVALFLAFAVFALIQHLRYPQPFVDFDSGRLKAGRRVVPFSEISWARFEIVRLRGQRPRLTLLFGAHSGPRVIFNVSSEGRLGMSPATRELIARVILQSRIEMPVSSYDASGRFASFNFPNNLDKQMALKAVKDPAIVIEEHPIV